MSNLPDNVTQADCDRLGSICTGSMTLAQFYRLNEDETPDELDSPQCVRDAFEEYATDQYIENGLHPDDDRSDMWSAFCEKVNNGEIVIKEKVAA